MTTRVSSKLAKLLKEKGFDERCDYWSYLDDNCMAMSYDSKTCVKMPTIAEVVMWLYEKHKIWVLALPTITGHFAYKIVDVQLNPDYPIERPPYDDVSGDDYESPTEAYESAIEYTLNNLI